MKRVRWKLPYIHSKFFKSSFKLKKGDLQLSNFRNSSISFSLVGKRCYIYNGAWSLTKTITEDMIGFKIGSFSITKKFDGQRNVKRKGKRKTKRK